MDSLLDNKETLEHKRNMEDNKNRKIVERDLKERNKATQETFSLFHKTKTKHINLTVAKYLEQSSKANHTTINKTIRRLRFCSTININALDFTGKLKNIQSSKRCKAANCATCRRAKSARLGFRLSAAMADPNNATLFENKYYYFLTLTLKHDDETRNYNYLNDFKKYQKALRRKKYFIESFTGGISSIENVISEEYHIHSHSLLCSNKDLNARIISDKIRNDWLKITGDSFIIDFQKIDNEEVQGAVLEVVKYSTKLMKIENLTSPQIEKLADWIIETKGKNFTNLLGNWAELDITKDKSIYDIKQQEAEIDDSDIVIMSRTSKNSFNFSTTRNYSKFGKEKMNEFLYLKTLDEDAIIEDGSEGALLRYFAMQEIDNKKFLEIKKQFESFKKQENQ